MKVFIIVILVLVCTISIFLFIRQRKQLRKMLDVLVKTRNGENKKIFVKDNGVISEIGFEINDLMATHNKELSRQKKLEQANKELLTSLSHDVRTPLTSLLGYLDALESNIVDGAEKEEYIKIARKKAYNLKELVDTLFDWFKIDSKEMKLSMQAVDICELTKGIIIDWLPTFEQNEIIPEIEIPDEEWIVELDLAAYGRMISNLIHNAVEHSDCSRLKVVVRQNNDVIRIIVKDNGIGISKDELSNIFERLYKGDRARSRQSSGLGLCIVKELTEMQGGMLTVQSNLGEYTEFIIEMPISRR
ncbi:MAG: HAMP domain-containing histidine kinase [Clostridiaceae bacterium]|nr:HAMP domain-containing histidine kinase [Clostridiaceae bacterium]MBW4858551.1 HAMP domain-containing histidine kinase [Clostridiaceae bacterium]MBW4867799.1 HAMP domain-containing histidine kinase [Clostridiaceae bacterium]MBW4868010.1 HAMP domain-containing histidine kinase [Clostridiaceae bacterium]